MVKYWLQFETGTICKRCAHRMKNKHLNPKYSSSGMRLPHKLRIKRRWEEDDKNITWGIRQFSHSEFIRNNKKNVLEHKNNERNNSILCIFFWPKYFQIIYPFNRLLCQYSETRLACNCFFNNSSLRFYFYCELKAKSMNSEQRFTNKKKNKYNDCMVIRCSCYRWNLSH